MKQHVLQDIEKKIELGLQPIIGKTILHTAPHHDDILLGYFPYVLRNLEGNNNHVLYVTSGANGVSDAHLSEKFPNLELDLLDETTKQELKFSIREAESEKKWSLCAGDRVKIKHLRAQFYNAKSDIDAAMDRDVEHLVQYFKHVQPDIITLLVDPIGIGPSTHYRSQQVITAALAQLGRSDIMIIGYRNVWSSFSLDKASMIVPVSQEELDRMESIFMQCFETQNTTIILGEKEHTFAQQAAAIKKAQLHNLVKLIGGREKVTGKDTLIVNNLNMSAGALFLQKLTVASLATIGTK